MALRTNPPFFLGRGHYLRRGQGRCTLHMRRLRPASPRRHHELQQLRNLHVAIPWSQNLLADGWLIWLVREFLGVWDLRWEKYNTVLNCLNGWSELFAWKSFSKWPMDSAILSDCSGVQANFRFFSKWLGAENPSEPPYLHLQGLPRGASEAWAQGLLCRSFSPFHASKKGSNYEEKWIPAREFIGLPERARLAAPSFE